MLCHITLALLALLSASLASKPCPIQGPDFLRPSQLAQDPVFKDVLRNISLKLDNATSSSNALLTDLKANETSYSIAVFDVDSTLFSFHHTADTRTLAPESVSKVTDDSVYRVGSISKLLTLYTFLVEAGHDYWHHPITDFVPELAEAAASCSAASDPLVCPDWCDITLGALASHLAGVGRGRPVPPASTDVGGVPAVDLGLPPKPVIAFEQCESQPCTRAESIRAFLQEPPVQAPFATPMYSNGGYQLLAYALEAITNRSISDMLTDDVFVPLGMNESSYALENGTAGIIPNTTQSSGWSLPLGDAGAAGGIFSSPRDLVKLGRSILNNTQLSPASTRRWLKPWGHTAVWQQDLGLAWEILRWPVGERIVDTYTKQGDIALYHSKFAIIPDYNVGLVVLAAGSGGDQAQSALFETVLTSLLPGLDATTRAQAESNLAGTYVSASSKANTTMTLEIEPSLPGLKVTEFVSNSSDVLHGLYALFASAKRPDVRLYPTDLVRKTDEGAEIRKYNAVVGNPDRKFPDDQIEAANCLSWVLVDLYVYGTIGLDEVWVETDGDGKGVNVELRAFGAKMERAN